MSQQNLNWLFKIELPTGNNLYLCSENRPTKLDKITYLPFSGLIIKEANFNDSAQNKLLIHGIFEDKGISRCTALHGSIFRIKILTKEQIINFAPYYLTEFIQNDLDFLLSLEPEVIKYNRPLLKLYSKKCRATFGDNKCKIDKKLYAKEYRFKQVDSKVIWLETLPDQTPNDYYKNGSAIICNIEYTINAHYGHRIELDRALHGELLEEKIVLLTPNCDKNFGTCCKKFYNAVNFRGEPNIPENKYLKS